MNTTLAIGTKFTYKNKTYIVTKTCNNAPICDGCDLYNTCMSSKDNQIKIMNISSCSQNTRKDKNNVIFKEVRDNITKRIAVPEGYEIDLDNSDLSTGTIVFKLKNVTISDVYDKYELRDIEFVSKCNYIKELFLIINYYNDGWKPKDGEISYTFNYDFTHKCYNVYKTNNKELIAFKTKRACEEMLNNSNFREIIDKAFGVKSDK